MKSSQHTPRKWTLIFNFLFTFSPRSSRQQVHKANFSFTLKIQIVVPYFHLCFEPKMHIFLTFIVCNFLVRTILKKMPTYENFKKPTSKVVVCSSQIYFSHTALSCPNRRIVRKCGLRTNCIKNWVFWLQLKSKAFFSKN